MKLLTNEQQDSYQNKKICYICYYTREYRGDGHSICILKYKVPKKITIVFHNGFNYDYHFIIKELAEEVKEKFTCLGEYTEKYITCSLRIEKWS